MKKTEQQLTTKLIKYLQHNKDIGSCAIEVKVITDKAFYFSKLPEHQLRALNLAYNKKIVWKLSDVTRTQLPFDIFSLSQSEAYVALIWKQPRKPAKFYLIDIRRMKLCMDNFHSRKKNKTSLTEQDAFFLSNYNGILK